MSGYEAIVQKRWGGPEVLELVYVPTLPQPGPDEVRVRIEAAGVGYTDTILRRGRYVAYTGGLPATPGYDMVGIVDEIGAAVTCLAVGDRVCDMPVSGSYADYMIRPAASLVPVPANVAPVAAVDVPLMGMTAWQMLKRVASVAPGDTILAVGASGAVGRLLVQLARYRGLKVIGTASSANLGLLEAMGATAIDYRRPDLVEAILAASDGGVAAAFDAIGGDSWDVSWNVLAPRGILVGYGSQDFLESGAPPEVARAMFSGLFARNELGRNDGSGRSATFYDINDRRMKLPDEYRQDATELLGLLASGDFVPPPAVTLRLSAAAEAHERIAEGHLQSRLVLVP